MSRRHAIVKLADDVYVEWVGAADAPGYAYTSAEVAKMLADEITEAENNLRLARLAPRRLAANGHTYIDRDVTPEQIVDGNRAGPGESTLTFDELTERMRAVLRRALP